MAGPYTKLDANQVLKHAFNETDDSLRVDATISASIGDVSVVDAVTGTPQKINSDGSINVDIISPINISIDASTDSIAIGQGSNRMTVNSDGTADVRVSNTLITAPFDYVGASYPSDTVETYLYRLGGATGTIVGLVTVTYTDNTKNLIASVSKS